MPISPNDAAEILWLSVQDVVQLNIRLVSETGEDHSVLSRPALEGAVSRPINLRNYDNCTDIVDLAVRLISGIAKDHCFVQGNKRTALHAGIAFMELNDVFLDLSDTEATAQLIVGLVTGSMEEEAVAEVLRKRQM